MISMPFTKGQSGNENGRPKQTQDQKDQKEQFQSLLKKATVPALQGIIEISADKRHRDRLNACKYIIDKYYGANTSIGGADDDFDTLTIRVLRFDSNKEDMMDEENDWV